ncbi:carbohydrate ABC transporter permease [Pelagibacterium xiamenense]|uniref:carbohydrate ABC transporter permease n=1 Tax=Pelagibacterium xiamenense TaxID=2901140 RepID=UPI001E5552A1|nr:sugar ABC transporter permease [Pelagibacterium xiamenense]MCD7060590.1 sugar ABC transporter permease [Pelagibacterium xiamenense]
MLATNNRLVGFLYLTPALLFVAVFVFYPLSQLIYISMTSESLLGGGQFVWFDNYIQAFTDRDFWRSFWFTVQYTVIITPILIGLGFLLALLVAENRPLVQFTRGVIFLPVVIGLASSSLLWVWLFDQQVGLLNKLLVDIGALDAPMVWFNRAHLGLFAVIVSVVWKIVGFGMIIMLAGMQTIGQDIVEASMIDGASYWQRVRRIIVPLSSRSILLATLISAIGSMLAFDQFYLMTGGAPRGQTFTSVYWIYQNSFVYFKLGYGSALSIILMVVIMCGAALQIAIQRRGEAQ